MKGADDFHDAFQETQQIGRLYLVVASHARGKTFNVYVLPEGEEAIPNGPSNPPLNSNAVHVYGEISGRSGWTECYGWLHHGKWQDDFMRLYEQAKARNEANAEAYAKQLRDERHTKEMAVERLLDSY